MRRLSWVVYVLGVLSPVVLLAQAPGRTNFGQVLVNGSITQKVTIANIPFSGTPTLSMKYGLEFTLGAPACTQSPTTCSVPVTFSPQGPGLRRDAVLVEGPGNTLEATEFVDASVSDLNSKSCRVSSRL